MSLSVRLALRFAVHHRGLVAAMVLTFLALGGTGTAVTAFQLTARDAVATSVRADNGGQRYAVQVLNPGPAATVVAADRDLHPVRDYEGTVGVGGRLSATSIRVLRDPLPIGILSAGAHPREHGEASISGHLARVLSVSVGDSITVRWASQDRPLRVTAIVTKPESATYDGVTTVDSSLSAASADLWLTDDRPFSDDALEPLIRSGDISARTTAILAEDRAAEFGAKLLPALNQASHVIVVVAAILALLLLTVLLRTTQHEVAALCAAGVRPSRAFAVPVSVGLVAVTAGTTAGAGIAVTALSASRSAVALLADQQWGQVSVPWSLICVLSAAVVLGAVAGIAIIIGVRRYRPHALTRWPVPAWSAAALAGGGVALMGLPLIEVLPVEAAIVGGVLLTLSVPGWAVPLSALRLPSATRRYLVVSATPFAFAAALVSLFSYGSAYYSAYVAHAGYSSLTSSPAVQPPGSFVINNITTAAADAVRTEYTRVGGRSTAIYILPVEDTHTLRVSGQRLIGCMRTSGSDDPQESIACMPKDTSSPVNIVALAPGLRPDRMLADPGLIEGRQVGLIDFDRDSSAVKSLDVTAAVGDDTLGGNMPGAVVSPDSPVAKQFKLRASDARLVALLDFDTVSESSQAQMRAFVTRLATTAQTSELSNGRLPEFTISTWTAATGGGAVLLLWLCLGVVLTTSQAVQRSLYAMVGAGRRQRAIVAARLSVTPLLSFLISGTAGIAAAWVSGVHDGSPFGWWWLLPPLLGVGATAIVAVNYSRSPA